MSVKEAADVYRPTVLGLAHRDDFLATVAAIAQAESLDELVPLIAA
jgi:hypothetical protein